MPKPLIFFSGLLLPSSETFIRAQGEGLQQFTPYYVGARKVKGLTLPVERTLVVNQGGFLGSVGEGLFKVLGSAPQLYQQVRQLNPVLLHAHFGLNGAMALPLARALNLPLVVTFHGSDATAKEEYIRNSSLNHWLYFRRRAALQREARLFIVVSEFIKEKLIEQGFPPEKIVVHHIGVDTEVFHPDPSIIRQPVVLFVGRLAEKKGCQYLIQAMAQVQAQMPDVNLAIVGDGPLRLELEQLAAKLLKRYQFLGLQPPQVVKSWMNRALILAAPSVTAATGDSEGLPTVVVEAQAMGLPVVGSIHAGIPQAVLHGETGLLSAERDWHGLAANILALLNNPSLWQSFSLKGQQRIRNNFDLSKQTQVLEGIYTNIWQQRLS